MGLSGSNLLFLMTFSASTYVGLTVRTKRVVACTVLTPITGGLVKAQSLPTKLLPTSNRPATGVEQGLPHRPCCGPSFLTPTLGTLVNAQLLPTKLLPTSNRPAAGVEHGPNRSCRDPCLLTPTLGSLVKAQLLPTKLSPTPRRLAAGVEHGPGSGPSLRALQIRLEHLEQASCGSTVKRFADAPASGLPKKAQLLPIKRSPTYNCTTCLDAPRLSLTARQLPTQSSDVTNIAATYIERELLSDKSSLILRMQTKENMVPLVLITNKVVTYKVVTYSSQEHLNRELWMVTYAVRWSKTHDGVTYNIATNLQGRPCEGVNLPPVNKCKVVTNERSFHPPQLRHKALYILKKIWPSANCFTNKGVTHNLPHYRADGLSGICLYLSLGVFKNQRHKIGTQVNKVLLAGDIETNPGPRDTESRTPATSESENKLILVTQNCRGITEQNKCKHLLDNCYKLGRKAKNFVIALQETMITNDGSIKYSWRGNHIFMAGTGHGRGCITLLPAHIQPEPNSIVHLGERGHIFKAIIEEAYVVVANIYAPTAQGREKVDFFRQVKDLVDAARDPGDECYLLGDFNTVFEQHELRARKFSNQEHRLATQIKQIIDSLSLQDSWHNNRTAHTWMQAGMKKSSRLDRIYYDSGLEMSSCEVDWSFTNSDHGAVVATFKEQRKAPKQRLLRLNQELLSFNSTKEAFLKEYHRQISDIPHGWDPHQELEFHKCAIRSAYLHINAERKKTKKLDYEFLKADLHTHIVALEESNNDLIKKNRLMDKINILKAKMSQLNLEKGRSLAEKMKTKWNNEGERLNKYFLGLLKRK